MKPLLLWPMRGIALLVSLFCVAALVPAAVAQTATLTPASHGFGSVGVGASSATSSFTLRNTSTTAALTVSNISTSGDFSQTTTCGSSVAARGNCTITVKFTPTATGARTGTLTVVDGAGTQTASLTGTGAAPVTLSPASRAYNNVAVGSTSAAKTFTVANKSGTTQSFSVVASAGFSETDNCGSVANNASCTINASAAPTAAGAETGTITVSYSGFGSPLSASMTATGIAPVTISPASRSFGNTAVGTTSAAKTFTVSNKTTAAMAFTVTPSAGFTETDNCASVAANATCTINASYAPTTAAAQTGTISVSYSGFGSPLSVSVSGTGIAPVTFAPASLAFSTTQRVGVPTNSKTVTLRNRAAVALAIQGIVASPASYTQTNTCGTSVAANGTCTITVIFTPAVPGSIPGTLTISDGAAGSPQVVAMTGAGAAITNLRTLAITPLNTTVPKGGTVQFKATGTYNNGTTGDLTAAATWASTNPAVAAIVSNTGLATGMATGATAISASVAGTTVTSSTNITVSTAALSGITLSPATASIAPGATQAFTATASFTDGTTAPMTANLVFGSDNTGVASVNSSGVATGINGGLANIRATSGTITSAPAALTVTGPTLQSITIAPAAGSVQKGLTQQYTATGNYSDGTHPDISSQVIWSAAPASIMTINATGLATGVAVGPATVGASWGNGTVTGSTTATVTPPPLTSISVCLGTSPCSTSTTPVGVTLGLNATQQLTAIGTYADNTTKDITSTATWSSFNTSVVTVSNTGLATVIATGVTPQAIAISASLDTITAFQNSDTVFITADPSLAITCPAPTIDMKLLVVDNKIGAGGVPYADSPAIRQILDYVGTPYDVVDVSDPAPTLSDGGCHGHYQGVIFAYGGDYYNIPLWQKNLIAYEQTFKVRHLNWYGVPDPNFGMNSTGVQIPSTQTYSTNFTPAAAGIFSYANTATPLTITYAAVNLATPLTGAGTVTPLLQDGSGNIVSAVYAPGNGQEFLTQTFDSNASLTHNLVVSYGLLNWVTKGIFLGDYHVYVSQQVDDFFIDDSEWVPSTTCLTNPLTQDRTAPDANNLPVIRVNTADMTQLVAWQSTKQADPLFSQFKLTMAFNGVGTAGNPDWTGLSASITSSSATNGTATFKSPGLAALPGEQVTITGAANSALNGTFTILTAVGDATTTPGTMTFTVQLPTNASSALNTENGATAAIADDLTANLQSYQGAFNWISHTFNHPQTLDGLCKSVPSNPGTCGDVANGSNPTDDIDLEILTNRWVASDPDPIVANLDGDLSDTGLKQLTFTFFDNRNIVTPGVSGLSDPNVPGYLFEDGIKYAVSDTSVIGKPNNGPNPSPNVGIVSTFNGVDSGIYEVPRYPNDIFYNAANWADDQSEFVCIYSHYLAPNAPAGTVPGPVPPFNTYNSAQILDLTASTFLANMLKGDMDPQMFHQPDLHFSNNYAGLTATPFGPANPPVTVLPGLSNPHISSLLTDTYDETFRRYKAVYNLPVLSATLDQLGEAMKARNAYNLSGVAATLSGAPGSQTVSITVTNPGTIPVSGLNVSGLPAQQGLGQPGLETYGGKSISHIQFTTGGTQVYPVQ